MVWEATRPVWFISESFTILFSAISFLGTTDKRFLDLYLSSLCLQGPLTLSCPFSWADSIVQSSYLISGFCLELALWPHFLQGPSLLRIDILLLLSSVFRSLGHLAPSQPWAFESQPEKISRHLLAWKEKWTRLHMKLNARKWGIPTCGS